MASGLFVLDTDAADGAPVESLSKFGHLAAGVPGTVDGMVKAFEKYSKLKDWKKLLQPAIDMAKNGYKITDREANNLNEEQPNFVKFNLATTSFHKSKWTEGDIIKHPELAATLESIRDLGRAGFDEGSVADHIVKEMQDGKGLISHEDLKNYQSQWRTPVTTMYRGHKVISMPPPSSGGIALTQLENS